MTRDPLIVTHHPERPGGTPLWRLGALLWLLVVLAVAAHQWHFWRTSNVDTDVLALLPQDERAPEVAQATKQLADAAARQVVVAIGAPDWPQAQRAAQAYRDSLQRSHAPLEKSSLDALDLNAALDFYRPHRQGLLTAELRLQLQHSSADALAQQALMALYQPGLRGQMAQWIDDPIGQWTAWWTARAAQSPVRPRDGWLWLEADGRQWIVLPFATRGGAFSMDGSTRLTDALAAAKHAAQAQAASARVLAAGIPLHAEAAASQANWEMNTIGWGSLAAIVLLVWLAFRALRPIMLVAVSLLVGTFTALSVTALIFGKVHLITLIFGASLVGVAEDFGIHYFACRQAEPQTDRFALLRHLLPGLALALLTSVLGYLVLGVAPFPGLRQMAVFSAVGLVAAFLTVAAWFPWLEQRTVRPSRFAQAISDSLARWPHWQGQAPAWAVAGVLTLLLVPGLIKLRPNDDIRQLQGARADLLAEQIAVSKLLQLPSPAQFFIVQGPDEQTVLQREEALKAVLDAEVARQHLSGYRAVSDWVPSAARQQADAQLSTATSADIRSYVGQALGESLRPPADAGFVPLTLSAWLAHPVSGPARSLWLGALTAGDRPASQASVVLLQNVAGTSGAQAIEAAAQGLPGVRWVNKTQEITSLMARYRGSMSGLLLLGYALVIAALTWRYGRTAWRAWVPTLLASLIAVALLGWLGQPLQLFNVLALLLLLGMGVDYGIFLLEHDADPSSWLAIVLGAASTLLSFGLLALSTTPALRAFGLTMLFGIGSVWVLAPCFRPVAAAEQTA